MDHSLRRLASLLLALSLVLSIFTPTTLSVQAAPQPPSRRAPSALPILDDFETGIPAGFVAFADSWNGSGSSTTMALDANDLPIPTVPYTTINKVAAVTYTVAITIPDWGGAPGYAGVTHDFAATQDWTGYTGISFWLYGNNTGANNRVELKSEGTNVDGASNRFVYTYTDNFSGWRFFDLPFTGFANRTDYTPGPTPSAPLNLAKMWGYSILLAPGITGTLYLDQVALTKITTIDTFETGIPNGFVPFAGSGSSVTMELNSRPLPTEPYTTVNQVVAMTYTVAAGSYAGVTTDFAASQDWTGNDGLALWLYGSNSGGAHRVELKSDGTNAGGASNRYQYTFTDDFSGWRRFQLPFSSFVRRTDYNPGPSPDDPINLGKIWGYSLLLDPNTSGVSYLDQVEVYGHPTEARISFSAAQYTVNEGSATVITATLNAAATMPVTVTYASQNGTATAGVDYTAISGTFAFPAGTTVQTATVQTLEDNAAESAETVLLNLSNPLSGTLGTVSQATLTIRDNDTRDPDPCSQNSLIVDNFENGLLPAGEDANGLDIGFFTWGDTSTTVNITTTAIPAGDPLARPGQTVTNTVVRMTSNVAAWGGMTHHFENVAVDTWTPQNWSHYNGVSFWMYGRNTGATMMFEIQDNRTAGSTRDDTEIWTYGFTDNFTGWRYLVVPFSAFARKDIGNGAPNDGFTLTSVHGWAFGSLAVNTTFYLDDVALVERSLVIDDFESNALPAGVDANNIPVGFLTWNDNASSVSITTTATPLTGALALPCQIGNNIVLQRDDRIMAWGGVTHHFENLAVNTWTPQDWSTYEGVTFWMYGRNTGATLLFEIQDNRNPGSIRDDAETWSYSFPDNFTGWQKFIVPFSSFARKDIGNGAPNDGFGRTEVHGWAFGGLVVTNTYYLDNVALYGNNHVNDLPAIGFTAGTFKVTEGQMALITATVNMTVARPLTINYQTAESYATPGRDFTPVSGTLVFPAGADLVTFTVPTSDDIKYEGTERLMLQLKNPMSATLAFQRLAALEIIDNESADSALLDDFEGYHPFSTPSNITFTVSEVASGTAQALPSQGAYEKILNINYGPLTQTTGFSRTYPTAQNWSTYQGLSLWVYGTNSGKTITVEVQDNQSAVTVTNPASWTLAWSDEFNTPAGTAPNPNIWTAEIGDGTLNKNSGWGNSELEFYTDSTDNAATDGTGNLIITTTKINTATTDLLCYYGPCQYTSARLLTWHKAEFSYGRIESRIQVPYGSGIWPAFWALGTNIDQVDWPMCGEIDIMEFVGRQPTRIFGTLHGPGYSGGNGYGNIYDFAPANVYTSYHTFAVEWTPAEIHWYVDGINYHNATPANVAPNQWVYDHPFFLLLNTAIGGNFGGAVGADATFPQKTTIDYVRVYQAPSTAERFENSFVDNFTGWKRITLPFSGFTRSAVQPAGAPNDGFNRNAIWGYGLKLPAGSGNLTIDQVRLAQAITEADLSIVQTRPVTGNLTAGAPFTYQLSLTNAGPLSPITATVTAGWAPTTAITSATVPAGCTANLTLGQITCAAVTLTTGITTVLPFTLNVNSSYTGPVTMTATAAPNNGITDPYSANNTATPLNVNVQAAGVTYRIYLPIVKRNGNN